MTMRMTTISGDDLRDAVAEGHRDFAHKSMTGANLRLAQLAFVRLRWSDLRGSDLGYADLRCADLRGANLSGTRMWGTDLRGAHMEGADLFGADLLGAKLDGADLCGTGVARFYDGDDEITIYPGVNGPLVAYDGQRMTIAEWEALMPVHKIKKVMDQCRTFLPLEGTRWRRPKDAPSPLEDYM